jgi:hypothetical protein
MPSPDRSQPSCYEHELFAALRRGIGLAAVLVGAVMAASTLAAAPVHPVVNCRSCAWQPSTGAS